MEVTEWNALHGQNKKRERTAQALRYALVLSSWKEPEQILDKRAG